MAARASRGVKPRSTVGRNYNVLFLIGAISVLIFVFRQWKSSFHVVNIIRIFSRRTHQKEIRLLTWNIAAINNNPFEYWITNKDENYNRIMTKVSAFIEHPDQRDSLVREIFTDRMFDELEESMIAAGWDGIVETRTQWESVYRDKKSISEFIKDSLLGKKRLASMPDRMTNTINTYSGEILTRPSVINCYNAGDLSTLDDWWIQWRDFMFNKIITVKVHGELKMTRVSAMISRIKRSKYPLITYEEEKISVPLQTLCLAIFDAILVNMMNTIDGRIWQPMREDMCNKLNRRKNDRTIEILQTSYANTDVQFLQEVASSFAETAKKTDLLSMFDVISPASMDTDRDQNSFILLKKGKFQDIVEVTADVLAELDTSKRVPIANGDLIAVTAIHVEDGSRYLLASFHGDTNGLATIPVLKAMHQYASTKQPGHKLLFGMDANTYSQPESDQQGVVEFADFYRSKRLNSCYGPKPNPRNFTTFHARTHLQPQLNKAVILEEKDEKGDKNPKDFILFFATDFGVLETKKDNTGLRKYVENMVFPTLSFPSDHGITSTVLVVNSAISSSAPLQKDAENSGLGSRNYLRKSMRAVQ